MFESYSIDPVFNVKAMVHQTGVAAATLRAWERRYGVPSPPRTDTGYRLYSARDVAIIRWLKAQIETGMTISQAVSLLQLQIGQPDMLTPVPSVDTRIPTSYQRLHDNILEAAGNYDEARIEQLMSEAFSLFSVEDVCINLIQPVLVTIGTRWHKGEVSIGTEHFVSNIMRRRLHALLTAAPNPVHDRKIITACAQDEYHELGILMVSVFLRRAGYYVIYLGQNTPAARLRETLETVRPSMVLISATRLRAAANLLATFEALKISESAALANGNSSVPIFAFGGRIFNQIPSLRDRMPGSFIGGQAIDSVQRISQILSHRELTPAMRPVPPRTSARALTEELRIRRPELISAASKAIMSTAFEFNTVAQKHERVLDTCDRLFNILDAAVYFDDASTLTDATYWEWDSVSTEGIMLDQLVICANAFLATLRTCLSPEGREIAEPFLSELASALRQ
jgi:MerR family transcriptional regulator, light-induced transcriptional regulator